ncbi:MAG: CHC2 zinc finger domain-containing protein [Dehalococcoidia bacterium]|jgi:DNA primase
MYDVLSIRRASPIEEVVACSGVTLRPNGRRLIGVCPFHADGRPSLVVYPQNDSYFCFGCGAGGDVIDFVARLNGVGFREAAAILSGPSTQCESNLGHKMVSIATRREHEPLTESERAIIEAAAAFYHDALRHDRKALDYLKERGIDRDTARRCRLGFGRPGLAEHLRRRRLSLAAAQRVGLLAGDFETMLDRIIVPDLRGGKATWFTGRALRQGTPRYLNLRLPRPLLGLDLVRGDEVVVTEGPFDWLTAVRLGLPAVALLGTHVSRQTAQALARFRRVYLALDADEAGCHAALQIAANLDGRGVIVELPPGVHDLNDLGRLRNGRKAFRRCLELSTIS